MDEATEDLFECECDCHDDPENVMHCMPCCSECPICGKRITDEEVYEKHLQRHLEAQG